VGNRRPQGSRQRSAPAGDRPGRLMAASALPRTEAAFHLDRPQDPLIGARAIGARAGPNAVTPAAARPPHRRRGR
jgi:hypothetical protein